jgi:hypothetical protein
MNDIHLDLAVGPLNGHCGPRRWFLGGTLILGNSNRAAQGDQTGPDQNLEDQNLRDNFLHK